MPVVDDASAAKLESAAKSLLRQRAGKHAEGTRDGDGKAADVAPLPGSESQDDMAVETPEMVLLRLRGEASQMKAAKKLLSKNLRNAKRVNARLKSKARKLSDAELLQIVAMRNGAGASSTRASSASSTAAASASGPPKEKAALSIECSDNAVDAIEHGDDEVRSGSASEPALDLERMADCMQL